MKRITIDELKQMTGSEGIILQGCGGDLQEWVDGINGLLTEKNILLDGDTFKDVAVFEYQGQTNLLFNMEDVKLDIGKLAMWRLQTHGNFSGIWLSDYLPNRLGVEWGKAELEEAQSKPDNPLIGADGNIFNLMGIASRTLKNSGVPDKAKGMCERVKSSGSYDEALAIIMEYVSPPLNRTLPYAPGWCMNTGSLPMSNWWRFISVSTILLKPDTSSRMRVQNGSTKFNSKLKL